MCLSNLELRSSTTGLIEFVLTKGFFKEETNGKVEILEILL